MPFRTIEAPHQKNEVTLPRIYTGERSSCCYICIACLNMLGDTDDIESDKTDPNSCYVVVNMTSSRIATSANWLSIWEAGVAVNTMCIQFGFSGKAIYLGRYSGASSERRMAINWK